MIFAAWKRWPTALALVAVALGVGVIPARTEASTITLNGTGAMSYTYQFLWSAPSSPTISNDYALGVPGQYTFQDSFSTQQPAGSNLGTDSIGPYDFQDSYRFSISQAANGDTLVASLGLSNGSGTPTFNIADLQFRLYEVVAPNGNTPVVGPIPTGDTVITGWMSAGSATFTDIQSGTYILDVAGIANGTNGGTYIGQLNVNAPVPLPPTLPLVLTGLVGLTALAGRRTWLAERLTPC